MRKSKTSAPGGVELRQSLLSESSGSRGLHLNKEQLCDLFHPDNIKNLHEGTKVSESLHKYWVELQGPQGLANGLNTHVKTGIEGDARDIKSREKKYGKNYKRPPKIRTLFELILENFEDRILQILLIAATVALIVGVVQHGWGTGWVEGMSIYIAVCIIVTVTAGNNYIKEKQFQKLVSKASEQEVAVFRGREGLTQTIPIQKLVVGDIIKIEAGMSIPADCVLLDSTDVAADEAALTGEPEQVEKSHVTESTFVHNPNPFLLAKTLVVQGQGLALVCAVGTNTRSGMAEEKLNIEEEETPLQAKLETIANEIGKIGVYVALLTFIAMTINMIVTTLYKGEESIISLNSLNSLVNFLIVSITVVVVAVPEGLPLAVTISLAFSVMKMKKDNNLVRKLEASETMGGASEICTDKTGTLTKNKMTVQEFYTLQQVYDGTKKDQIGLHNLSTAQLLTEGVLFNCSARVEKTPTGLFEAKGNCTEVGLINFLMFAGINAAEQLKKKEDRILEIIPFNSARKRACTVVRHPDDDNKVRVFLKGAPEIVLDYCSSTFDLHGSVVPLNESDKKELVQNVITNGFARKAFRTLLISYRDYSYDEYVQIKAANNGFASEKDREALEKNMTVIGIYALMDPLREEIVDSAIKCRKAGINIRMVTGDNTDTARAIALNAGILTEEEAKHEYAVMDGKTFREICGGLRKLEDPNDTGKLREEIGNKKVFRDVEKRLKVLARSTPEDKYMLVTGLKELGKVVAVTGDGTNDAPALKKADVGFAMGITGTEVAKEASDIILLDDNFASIVTAVMWGRNIYTNVRKFLQFQLTVNCVAMFIVFLGGVVVAEPPLTSVQMLWVNLIMDTFAALALATEPPSSSLLEQPPYGRSDIIVTPVMWRNIIGQGLYQATILVVMLFAGGDIFGLPFADNDAFYADKEQTIPTNRCIVYTMIFHTFVFMQVFNEINSRKLGEYEYNVFQGFFNNWLFISVIVLTIAVQCCMVQYGGLPVRAAPLTWTQHAICISIGFFSLIQGVLVKLLLPVRWFARLHMKEEPMTDEEEKEAFTTQFRKSFRASHRRSTQKVNIQ